jgi:predicted glycoside hydrolase/deacetylase ChbG (UPF0249 family)
VLIVNADDWGRSTGETDAAFLCYQRGRVTSVSAMVFMKDSDRAAALAKSVGLDVGLHLNFTDPFDSACRMPRLQASQGRLNRFLKSNRYANAIYNPFLRATLREVYRAQVSEFHRLYGRPPSHFDGHHHMHLCANILFDEIIPRGQRVRRSFSFWPGEKPFYNRLYRRVVDLRLCRLYRTTDYFFALPLPGVTHETSIARVFELAKTHNVEVMAHPADGPEFEYLLSRDYGQRLSTVPLGTYASL